MGETLDLFPVLYGLWVFNFIRAQYQPALELAEQMLRLAELQPDSGPLIRAYISLGQNLVMMGRFTAGQETLEQGLALYDIGQHRELAYLYGQDPGVSGLSFLSMVLWLRGYPDQARQQSQAAVSLAREISHPFSLAYALTFNQVFLEYCREWKRIQQLAAEAIPLSTNHGFPLWLGATTSYSGLALAKQGQLAAGIAKMHQAIAMIQATGMELFYPIRLANLSSALGDAGEVEEALTLLAEGLTLVEKTGEHQWEAELHRIKGELLLKQGVDDDEVEQQFQQAIDIAHSQEAKSLELRAVMSLSHLWRDQGNQKAARQLLAEIYGWFSEGFDTADLIEARALLDELEK